MTLISDPIPSVPLVDRAKGIILKPGAEWDRIALETTPVEALFRSYAVILAAIGPVCMLIGSLLFGYGAFGVTYRPSVLSAVIEAIVAYVMALAMVFVLGLIIDALAPNFGGTRDRRKAMQVAVYSATASWLVGVFGLIPQLSPLAILGLYSLYLLYLGLPKLMQAPAEKALPYTAVVIVVAVVLSLVIGALMVQVRVLAGGGLLGLGAAPSAGTLNGEIKIGDARVDLGKLEAASKQMEAQAKAMQGQAAAGAAGAIGADVLKALLPASAAGYARGEVSTESAGAGGMGVSSAKADYARGDARMTVEITDMSAMGGLAGLAGAMGVQSSRETASGYEKVATVNGRMTTEEYDGTERRGKFSVLAGGRVMVEAQGTGVTMDELKAAVAAVGPDRIEALAKR